MALTRVIAATFSALILGACGAGSSASPTAFSASPTAFSVSPSPTPSTLSISGAVKKCNLRPDLAQYATIGDGGRSITLDGGSDSGVGDGVTIYDIMCILRWLGATDAMISRMQQTRALDGMQQDSWPGYKASWTYHPDNGLDVVVEKAS